MNKIKSKKILKLISALSLFILLTGCSKKNTLPDNRFVIWTSNAEFAQYVELFNSTHPQTRAILVFKENPALSLPPAKDEVPPDIIIGPWLRSENAIQYFTSLEYLFERKHLSSSLFYTELLDSGKSKGKQYLLPVSFNLPTIIFSDTNSQYVEEKYTLDLDQLKKAASFFNNKKRSGAFNKLGFSPLNNPDFLYFTSKIFDTNFYEHNGKIKWNKDNLNKSINYLSDWITTENTSVQAELDFDYKYLSMPYYRQVISGLTEKSDSTTNTLFAYTTSDQLFKILREQELNIDYRWLSDGNKIPVEDNMIMLGIYKKAENQIGASEFISWFFQPENQKTILDRKINLNLNTEEFGISGGFSSLQQITEKNLPGYYTQMLSNLPPSQLLKVTTNVPPRWNSLKTLVIEPYIRDTIIIEDETKKPNIEDLEKEWRKKVFD